MMLVNNIFSQNSFKIVCLFGVMETETSTDVFICVLMFSCPISLSSESSKNLKVGDAPILKFWADAIK